MKEKEIIEILNSHESVTYPKGVGSVFYCIKSYRYKDIAKDDLSAYTNIFMEDKNYEPSIKLF